MQVVTLQNLYGSSHSYLQNLMVQQDYDSKFDHFHTTNIDIKDIHSHGNVNVSLQELSTKVNLYAIGPNGCGQITTSQANVVPSQKYNSALKVGTCANQGYTIPSGKINVQLPEAGLGPFGNYDVYEFEKPMTFYQIGPNGCGQIETFKENVAPTLAYDAELKAGTCASVGYSQADGTQTVQLPEADLGKFGIIYVKKFLKDVTFYQIGPNGCGQISTYEANVAPTLAYDAELKSGTCASQGYSQPDGTQTVKLPEPNLGDFGIIYVKKFLKDDNTFYQIGPDGCGQVSTYEANVAPTLAYDASLVKGTCASQGYTVANGTQTVVLPEANLGDFGNIYVKKFLKPTSLQELYGSSHSYMM